MTSFAPRVRKKSVSLALLLDYLEPMAKSTMTGAIIALGEGVTSSFFGSHRSSPVHELLVSRFSLIFAHAMIHPVTIEDDAPAQFSLRQCGVTFCDARGSRKEMNE